MGKLFALGVLAIVGWLIIDRRARGEVLELLRDASDELMMRALRGTSGFADDVPEPILREEQERRLRWQ